MSKDSGSGGGRVGCVCECGCDWNGRVDGGGRSDTSRRLQSGERQLVEGEP
jgi:hypothetical protein